MPQSLRLSNREYENREDAIRVLMLSQLRSVGIERLGRVLHAAAARPDLLKGLFASRTGNVGAELELSDAAIEYLRTARKHLQRQCTKLLERIEAIGATVLWPGHSTYPPALAAQEGDGLPPLLFCLGDISLLSRPKVAIINSHRTAGLNPKARWVEITLALCDQLGRSGYALLVGSELHHHSLARFKALKDKAALIHVLDTDLFHWHEANELDAHGLIVTAIPPQRGPRPRATRMQMRDRLLFALADLAIAVEVRKGGVMEREGLAAIKRGQRVAVARLAPYDAATAGNRALLRAGAEAFTPDTTGESLERTLVETAATSTAAARRSRTITPAEDVIARRQRLGQFFTPPEVAGLMWDMVEVLLPKKGKGSTRLAIDPAAGEGVFLKAALERGWPADQLIGTDLDETLQPAWRAIFSKQPEIGLHVANGLLDHPWLGIEPECFDVVIGNPPFGGEGLRCLELLLTPPKPEKTPRQPSLFAEPETHEPQPDLWEPKREALRKHGEALEQLARAVVREYESWQLSRVTAAEIEGLEESDVDGENGNGEDTLPGITLVRGAGRARQVAEEFNLEQLVFRSGAPLSPKEIAALKRLSSFPIEILFAERFVQLCKPGGIIAVILPDGILASAKTQTLRNWILERAEVMAIVSLPQDLFTGVGAKAKTSIVLMRKYTTVERRMVDRLKRDSGAACVVPPALADHTVLMTSQSYADREVPLAEYLHAVRVAWLRQRCRGRRA